MKAFIGNLEIPFKDLGDPRVTFEGETYEVITDQTGEPYFMINGKAQYIELRDDDGNDITPGREDYEHGKALKHCVFSNQYHKRESSLLLAAMVDCQLAETIEVDLKNMKIAQARGLQNRIHKEHSAIVNLLNTKLPEVKKLYKKHQRATVAA